MEYYYTREISPLVPPCPPDDYESYNKEVFRWVFEHVEDENNFKAQAEKKPAVLNHKDDERKCAYYALSFHTSLEKSKQAFAFFRSTMKLASKRLGTNVAKGMLTKDDGIGSIPDKNGHINFHHYKARNFEKRFVIVDTL
jgi:hypothetical protein